MRINFDFTDLSTFLAVAELGSFQRAAESLHLSQSAVTRRIQKLEESLGVTLFERTTRSLKLTLAARLFRDRAKAILDNAEEAIYAVSDEQSQLQHHRNTIITIATIQTATHAVLAVQPTRWTSRSDCHKPRLGGKRLFRGVLSLIKSGQCVLLGALGIGDQPRQRRCG